LMDRDKKWRKKRFYLSNSSRIEFRLKIHSTQWRYEAAAERAVESGGQSRYLAALTSGLGRSTPCF
jgi:hypothetical protein